MVKSILYCTFYRVKKDETPIQKGNVGIKLSYCSSFLLFLFSFHRNLQDGPIVAKSIDRSTSAKEAAKTPATATATTAVSVSSATSASTAILRRSSTFQ